MKIFDMMSPMDRAGPATEATIGSTQQFWAETTKPFVDRWRRASCVAQAVS